MDAAFPKHWQHEIGVGSSIGQTYSILNTLDSGTYSTVYLARELHSGEEVAVKASLLECAHAMRCSIIESRMLDTIAAQENCPGKENCAKMIATILIAEYRRFVVLPVYGQNLMSFMMEEQELGLPVPEIQFILKEILIAIDFLHMAGIVHTDIKTANVCYARHHVQDTITKIKIIDFGNAVSADRLGSYEVCTPFYRPPEVWLKNFWTPKIDLYGVGCIALELFKGNYLLPTHHAHEYLRWTEKLSDKRIPQSLKHDGNKHFFNRRGSVVSCGECGPTPEMAQLSDLFLSEDPLLLKFHELCAGLLEPDPTVRFSAEEALNQLFFEEMIANPDNE